MSEECPFCELEAKRVINYGSNMWFVIRDNYPVNSGHSLVVLSRHEPDLFDVSSIEWGDLWGVLLDLQDDLRELTGCTAFNVGVNVGEAAGQTVPHVHIHVIPRHEGDCEDPRGGVRKVKPPLVDY